MKHADIARALFEIGCIKFGEFKLKLHEKEPDAPLSPIYVDLRVLQSHPDDLKDIAMIMKWDFIKLVNELNSDEGNLWVAGIPIAGIPLATALSINTGYGAIMPRIDKKTHGSGASVDGSYRKGDFVFLVDDLITTCSSKLEAIEVLEAAGLKVKRVMVILDRCQGGLEALGRKQYAARALLRLDEVMKFYKEQDMVTEEQYNRVTDYMGW